jgi:hypothetical protein
MSGCAKGTDAEHLQGISAVRYGQNYPQHYPQATERFRFARHTTAGGNYLFGQPQQKPTE